MIYCVIPQELEDELFEQLSGHYADNPNVTVIVDRRGDSTYGGKRETRDRRRQRVPGTFLSTDAPPSA